MHDGTRYRPLTTLTLFALLVLVASAAASKTLAAPGRARVARSLRVADHAHLHHVACACSAILEEGEAKGSLPGVVRAYVTVGTPIVFRFTITVRGGGTISGEGDGRPSGNPAEPSFAGTMTVRRGTGRYSRAHGKGGLYGTLNRSTYAAVLQTTGTLAY